MGWLWKLQGCCTYTPMVLTHVAGGLRAFILARLGSRGGVGRVGRGKEYIWWRFFTCQWPRRSKRPIHWSSCRSLYFICILLCIRPLHVRAALAESPDVTALDVTIALIFDGILENLNQTVVAVIYAVTLSQNGFDLSLAGLFWKVTKIVYMLVRKLQTTGITKTWHYRWLTRNTVCRRKQVMSIRSTWFGYEINIHFNRILKILERASMIMPMRLQTASTYLIVLDHSLYQVPVISVGCSFLDHSSLELLSHSVNCQIMRNPINIWIRSLDDSRVTFSWGKAVACVSRRW
jgi:hypothetical protein